mmetsp:Transcript_7340/g.19070  ORF Transcript_7340/g.19070 Transcript_7340/m.19070 type:complete len:217 (+) Transcript_7340:809-1459(+)
MIPHTRCDWTRARLCACSMIRTMPRSTHVPRRLAGCRCHRACPTRARWPRRAREESRPSVQRRCSTTVCMHWAFRPLASSAFGTCAAASASFTRRLHCRSSRPSAATTGVESQAWEPWWHTPSLSLMTRRRHLRRRRSARSPWKHRAAAVRHLRKWNCRQAMATQIISSVHRTRSSSNERTRNGSVAGTVRLHVTLPRPSPRRHWRLQRPLRRTPH